MEAWREQTWGALVLRGSDLSWGENTGRTGRPWQGGRVLEGGLRPPCFRHATRGHNARATGDTRTARARLGTVKIYTRAGDDGTTGTLGPGRVAKSDPRIESYGTVDELNATLGVARAADSAGWLANELEAIQRQLFHLGAELATTDPTLVATLVRIGDADVAELEQIIDRLEAALPPLRNFVLPAGTPLAAQLHVARTVCRRAERRVVALACLDHDLEPRLTRYLNRLSDLLFVMARWSNHRAGASDVEWHP